jgi:hypothetical protein
MVAHLYPRREVLSRPPQATGVLSDRDTSRRAAPQAASAPGGVSPLVVAAFLDLPSPLWHRLRTLSFVNVSTGLRQTPDRAEQRVITKKVVDREFDQVLRMWMPYDSGFLVFQPHLRNMAAGSLRRTDGYGSPPLARTWLDK